MIGELETLIGHGKLAWPLPVIRALADTLLEAVAGRYKSPAHEVRWLNLTGFCVRPGFGSALDEWRVSELRKVYAAGLAFPKEIQNQVEWLVLWQRVAAGFSAGQQRELAQRVSGQLGLGQRKPARHQPAARTRRRGGCWPRSNGSMPGSEPGMATSSSIGSARSRAARTGSGR